MDYGRSTGLSGVAVVVAAAFWTLLWGPVGLLLSTPLTMCLVVLGRHVEHLQFLEVLLGDRVQSATAATAAAAASRGAARPAPKAMSRKAAAITTATPESPMLRA